MKKLIYFIPLFLILLVSCTKQNHPLATDVTADMSVSLNLSPAYDHGFFISKVQVNIRKDAFQDSMFLLINEQTQIAQGTFENLIPGEYLITVKAYEGYLFIASGQGYATVQGGENNTVNIDLQLVNGGLAIIIDWNDWEYVLPQKLLFIGNSYTYASNGLWNIVKGLYLADFPIGNLQVSQVTHGGYTLQDHYDSQETCNAIDQTKANYVILQEQSQRPVYDPIAFYDAVRLLNVLINRVGSKTALYMTHAREYDPGMIDGLNLAYTSIAQELNIKSCPAGLAWSNVSQNYPNISLYESDGSHPNFRGSYLNACVIYAVLFRKNPIGNTYINDSAITNEEKMILQSVAWQTVCEYYH